jgi:hypothetical protein
MPSCLPLQNFFLYFYGMCFNLLGLLGMMATGHMRPGHMLAGFRAVGAAAIPCRVMTIQQCLCMPIQDSHITSLAAVPVMVTTWRIDVP